MPDVEKLATEKSGADKAHYMAWLDALSEGAYLQEEAHLGESAFQRLAEACATPKQFSIVVEAFDEHAKEHPKSPNGYHLLADLVDDSMHDLREWLAAIEYFYDWLAQNNRTSPGFIQIVEYISCSAEAQAGTPLKEPLPDVVAAMLDQYGFEG